MVNLYTNPIEAPVGCSLSLFPGRSFFIIDHDFCSRLSISFISSTNSLSLALAIWLLRSVRIMSLYIRNRLYYPPVPPSQVNKPTADSSKVGEGGKKKERKRKKKKRIGWDIPIRLGHASERRWTHPQVDFKLGCQPAKQWGCVEGDYAGDDGYRAPLAHALGRLDFFRIHGGPGSRRRRRMTHSCGTVDGALDGLGGCDVGVS